MMCRKIKERTGVIPRFDVILTVKIPELKRGGGASMIFYDVLYAILMASQLI